jgi:hypothetical protein
MVRAMLVVDFAMCKQRYHAEIKWLAVLISAMEGLSKTAVDIPLKTEQLCCLDVFVQSTCNLFCHHLCQHGGADCCGWESVIEILM